MRQGRRGLREGGGERDRPVCEQSRGAERSVDQGRLRYVSVCVCVWGGREGGEEGEGEGGREGERERDLYVNRAMKLSAAWIRDVYDM